jgi:hypothetical protein
LRWIEVVKEVEADDHIHAGVAQRQVQRICLKVSSGTLL